MKGVVDMEVMQINEKTVLSLTNLAQGRDGFSSSGAPKFLVEKNIFQGIPTDRDFSQEEWIYIYIYVVHTNEHIIYTCYMGQLFL